ncbi:TolC family outer membrane protein [Thiomicrospira sp. ALE5]|uniref:TolC family outer membrane protein n=1 Tax=Thiomicrospira sp. ALE5 TaxID=748650 RepID=UPI0008E616D2|nr:TolC family outer membrane protein [Thiomicrospira sp. ALE5]SFR50186.1 outer membrane protein [Thiomicrospira sp. ALE5]
MKQIKCKLNQWLSGCSFVGIMLVSGAGYAAPGLLDVYQMALIHDAELAQARSDLEADQQQLSQARSLLLPKVNATAGLSYPDVDRNQNRQTLGLRLDQPIYNREAFSLFDEATIGLNLAELRFTAVKQGLIMRVSQAYFDLLLAQQTLDFAQAREAAEKIQWERAQAAFEVGLASRTDVLQTRSAYDLAMADRIDAENSVDITQEALRRLTGQPVLQVQTLPLDQQLQPDAQLVRWAEQAGLNQDFSQNLAVQLATEQQRLAEQGIATRQADRWFDVNLSLSHTRTECGGSDRDPMVCRSGDNTEVSINATLPLYQGGLTSSRVDEARFRNQTAMTAVREAREQASLDARVSLRNLERGQARINALREAVKSNEAFLEAAEEGYRVGLRNLIDVVTARSNLFNAQNNLAQAMQAFVLDQLQLKQVVKQLNADDLSQVDRLLVKP